MTVLKLKKPAEQPLLLPVEAPEGTPNEIADLIERVGAAQPEVAKIGVKMRALQKEMEPYRADLKELTALICGVEGYGDDDEFTMESPGFDAKIGKKGSSRSVHDIRGVLKAMGEEQFFKVVTVTMRDVDAYMTAPEKAKVLTVTRGERTVVVSAKTKKQLLKAVGKAA